ncbi:hypothetical protein M885DRAFT_549905 [Pelagophyceae sp. CCMP2097]|nr:hypothetical protein M885DRAFT_549905 [Pelagophyceae sp. CCMP2097]
MALPWRCLKPCIDVMQGRFFARMSARKDRAGAPTAPELGASSPRVWPWSQQRCPTRRATLAGATRRIAAAAPPPRQVAVRGALLAAEVSPRAPARRAKAAVLRATAWSRAVVRRPSRASASAAARAPARRAKAAVLRATAWSRAVARRLQFVAARDEVRGPRVAGVFALLVLRALQLRLGAYFDVEDERVQRRDDVVVACEERAAVRREQLDRARGAGVDLLRGQRRAFGYSADAGEHPMCEWLSLPLVEPAHFLHQHAAPLYDCMTSKGTSIFGC